MDPLTHTLVGANLGGTALGTKTRFAMAALVLGANIPDVDAVLYLGDYGDLSLGFRRGWTHGVLAWFVLPFLLTGLLLLCGKLRPDAARPLHARWLLALSAIGVFTHPFLDWLNTYGIRLLMPFRGTWFYGDSVYIMDPWLWLILGVGFLLGRKASFGAVGAWLFFTIAIARVVNRRDPDYLPLIALIAAILLLALLLPMRRFARVAATAGVITAALYIGSRIVISAQTAKHVRAALERTDAPSVERVMVSPEPLDPRRWGWVAETGTTYRYGRYVWGGDGFELEDERVPKGSVTAEVRRAMGLEPSLQGYFTWWRLPGYRVDRSGERTVVHFFDARRLARGRGDLSDRVVVLE